MMRALRVGCLVAGVCLLPLALLHGQSNLEVKGLGFFKNRSLDARLSFLHDLNPRESVELDAALLEDTAFLLLEQAKREGYLKAQLKGTFVVAGGAVETAQWQADYSIQLRADFKANHAVFKIIPGPLYYYDSLTVAGIDALSSERVKRFFIPGGVLFVGKSTRIFTYENLRRRNDRLIHELYNLGYREAHTESRDIEVDPDSGAVQVKLLIQQGPLYRIGDLEIVVADEDGKTVTRTDSVGEIFDPDWEQDERLRLRNAAYAKGYPDVKVQMEILDKRTNDEGEQVCDLRFRVDRGPKVRLSGVEFVGDEETRRSVLRRQANLQEGAPLNLLEAGEARRKLMALGIFKEVGMAFEPEGGEARDAVYSLEPGQRKELRLQAGWGSYEQARAGLYWDHRNPWGRAHRYDLGVKQSFKSSDVSAQYSIPQFLGSDLVVYTRGEYKFREELAFERESQGVRLGTSTALAATGINLGVEYGLFREKADRDETADFETEESATVAAIVLRATLDRRDDFLAPTSGYSLFASFKTANQVLGGSVDFQKMEAGGSYHFSISDSMITHLGLRYGTIFSGGKAEENIPFNERFFPGGENSVRGYREGEATPLNLGGDEIGAETYLQGNIEMEQRLVPKLSLVGFVDWAAVSKEGVFEEDGDLLYSVGLGVRYQTVVGPVRLEYGHNPDPREGDPKGTLHFSIGFPF